MWPEGDSDLELREGLSEKNDICMRPKWQEGYSHTDVWKGVFQAEGTTNANVLIQEWI